MHNLLTLLINLDGSRERLEASARQLDGAGIAYERLPAVDGRNLAAQDFACYREDETLAFFGRVMTGGEIGCYLSHVEAVKCFLASQTTYGLVLEDDFKFRSDSAQMLHRLLDWLDGQRDFGWHIIHLGRKARLFAGTSIKVFHGEEQAYRLCHAHMFPTRTTALLWSRAGAEDFLAAHEHIRAPIDHTLQHRFSVCGRGLAMRPSLMTIIGASSQISAAVPRRQIRKAGNYRWVKLRRLTKNYLGMTRNMIAVRRRKAWNYE